jgi:hypothetical protein
MYYEIVTEEAIDGPVLGTRGENVAHRLSGSRCCAVSPACVARRPTPPRLIVGQPNLLCRLEAHVRRRSGRLMRRRSGGLLRRSGQPGNFQSRSHRRQRQLRNGPSADMTRVAWTSVMEPQVGQRTPSAITLTTKDQVPRSHSVDGEVLEPSRR